MRIISAPAVTQLQSGNVKMALLVEMLLSAPVRLNTANVTLTYGGVDYIGTGILGGVNEVEDSPGEYKNLTFSLSGVDVAVLSIALAENVRDKKVSVRLAVLSETDNTVLDAPLIWTGTIDQMPVQMGDGTATINVSAEHRGLTFSRPKPLNYNNTDQTRIDPTDTSLRFIQAQSTHNDTWPAATYFRR